MFAFFFSLQCVIIMYVCVCVYLGIYYMHICMCVRMCIDVCVCRYHRVCVCILALSPTGSLASIGLIDLLF